MMKEKRQSKITIIVIILCLILLALSGLSLVLSLRSMKLSEQCCQMKVSETQSDYVNPLDQQQIRSLWDSAVSMWIPIPLSST